MTRVLPVFGAVVLSALALTAQQTPQTPGQLRPRPAEGRTPEFPAPSILDYKPRSTLVVPEHPVPRAKFPAVDFHGHPPTLNSVDAINRVVAALDSVNVRTSVVTNDRGGWREHLALVQKTPHKERFVFFTNVSLDKVGPGFGQRAAQRLEEDVKAGAVGVGELGKNLGLRVKKADGSRLAVDDRELDAIFEACARLNIPLFLHIGEPSEFFAPLDFNNERWLEMALFADRRYNNRAENPSFEALVAERDRMLLRHPKTTVVLGHMGWQANNLGALAAVMDKLPNLHVEVGAILYDLGRQPRTARAFFEKYQDRVLFGKDSFQPDEYPFYWRVFETSDEYFDYYRDYHAFWKLYGIGLSDQVLRKVYFQNAARIVPNFPGTGSPK